VTTSSLQVEWVRFSSGRAVWTRRNRGQWAVVAIEAKANLNSSISSRAPAEWCCSVNAATDEQSVFVCAAGAASARRQYLLGPTVETRWSERVNFGQLLDGLDAAVSLYTQRSWMDEVSRLLRHTRLINTSPLNWNVDYFLWLISLYIDSLTELWFYFSLDTKYIISETFFIVSVLVKKLNLGQQKQTTQEQNSLNYARETHNVLNLKKTHKNWTYTNTHLYELLMCVRIIMCNCRTKHSKDSDNIFPSILQTIIIIAQMMTTGKEGVYRLQ